MTDPILKRLYHATETRGDFGKVVDFLGNMAEAESFKGKKTSNSQSSASGIFHFLVGNGGGYNKSGQRVKHGKYNAMGQIATSSFQTAQTRLKKLMSDNRFSDTIASQGLHAPLVKILSASTPNDLSEQEQAVLAYANLKMKGDKFGDYLEGKVPAVEVYASDWVTKGKTHSMDSITKNWNNAMDRNSSKDDYAYFGLARGKKSSAKGAPSMLDLDQYSNPTTAASDAKSISSPKAPYRPTEGESLYGLDGTRIYKGGGNVVSERTPQEALSTIKNKSRLI